MLLVAALATLVAGASVLPPPAPPAVEAVPEEPGATMLPEAVTAQAVVADLDDDGAREVVRLLRGDGGSVLLEAWTEGGDGWEPAGETLEVAPPSTAGPQPELDFTNAPVRLLVRRVGSGERVTLARQPALGDGDLLRGCCLLLDDVRVDDGSMRLEEVAEPGPNLSSLVAIDVDGDGVDELAGSFSLPVRGFPTELSLLRWDGQSESFGPPIVSNPTRCCSGDTPFVLGDTDGVPGEELGFFNSRDGGVLWRAALRDRGALGMQSAGLATESSGLLVSGAVAIPLEGGRGVAMVSPADGVTLRAWPVGQPAGDAVARSGMRDASILGLIGEGEDPMLVVQRTVLGALHAFRLSDVGSRSGLLLTRTPAADRLDAVPVGAFSGPIPGGGLGGEPAVVYGGRLLPADDGESSLPLVTAPIAAMAGVRPIGLAGLDRRWMVLHHAPLGARVLDPRGGLLEVPTFEPASNVSLAPLEVALEPESDGGALTPSIVGGTLTGEGDVAVGPEGFFAVVDAPPGSRIYVADSDPSVIDLIRAVPESGSIRIPVVPPPQTTPNPRFRASLAVVTPGGHGYVATWGVQVLNQGPDLTATTHTPLGSAEVEVAGRTAPYAEVSVAGQPVEVDGDGSFTASIGLPPWPTDVTVAAVDPVGNRTSTVVSGIGVLDYRAVPWIGIVVLLLAAAAVILFVRVPRTAPVPRRTDDDAVLEEIEPD